MNLSPGDTLTTISLKITPARRTFVERMANTILLCSMGRSSISRLLLRLARRCYRSHTPPQAKEMKAALLVLAPEGDAGFWFTDLATSSICAGNRRRQEDRSRHS